VLRHAAGACRSFVELASGFDVVFGAGWALPGDGGVVVEAEFPVAFGFQPVVASG
jgi:hypothetical protein